MAICILGCKVNQSEGESFLEYFKKNNYQINDFGEKADVYLIHTCTVTSQADSKSRQMIRKAKKQNPKAKIIVTGCYAQIDSGKLKNMLEVDLIVGMKDRDNIIQLLVDAEKEKVHITETKNLKNFENMIVSDSDKTRAFIKIQEGCESYCSYCIIPLARGPIRSRKIEDILEEINYLKEKGCKEIVLTGIHTGFYGKDLNINISFLMKEILKKTDISRIRFGSLGPNEISEEFLEIFKNERFMPHIHLPLQSGDDYILKKMNRKYNSSQYLDTVKKLKGSKGEKLSVTTDIMVGFPYEKEEHHRNSLDFICKSKIDNLHIFKYSKRKNTRAADFSEQVEDSLKKIRAKDMEKLRDKLHLNFQKKMVGKKTLVLVEKVDKNYASGYSDNYLKVKIVGGITRIKDNNIYSVAIKGIEKNQLIGEISNGLPVL